MYKKIIVLCLLSFIMVSCSGDNYKKEVTKPKPTAFNDRISYAIGYQMGLNMKSDSIDINIEYLAQGLQKALKGDSTFFTKEDLDSVYSDFQKIAQKRKQEKSAKDREEFNKNADKNKVEGEKYLEENKKKAGVKVTSSGLQYEVLTEGKGPKPTINDVVKVNLKGMFVDGKEFDNTADRGPQPIPVKNDQIKGWEEALLDMKVGEKRRLVLPPNLALGEKGAFPTIPPNATLIFELELVSIEKK